MTTRDNLLELLEEAYELLDHLDYCYGLDVYDSCKVIKFKDKAKQYGVRNER